MGMSQVARAFKIFASNFAAKIVEDNIDIVKHHARKYDSWGVPQEDLEQEGRLGLLAAIDAWRPDGGAAFRTYAFTAVRTHIRKAVATVHNMTGAIVTPRCPAHLSLDAELEGGSTLHDLLGDAESNPEEAYAKREVAEQVEQALRVLTPAERALIDDRYVNGMTMAEVGEARGRTRQRIQQIESKSLARVRKALHAGR